MDTEDITLPQHETASQARADHLGAKIDSLKEKKMGQPVNVFTTPTDGGGSALPLAAMAMGSHGGMGGAGAGLGAGLVGGLLGGLLFGGRGFGTVGGVAAVDGVASCGARRDCLTPDMAATQTMGLATAIGGVNASVMALADKQAMSDMQLMNSINGGFAMQNAATLQQTIMLVQQANANQLLTMQELCGINQNVSAQGCQTREAIVADGNVTRGLLSARFQLEDATEINKLNAKVIELQNEGRTRELGSRIDITNTNTATATAEQRQAQLQFQFQDINNKIARLCEAVTIVHQEARATNSNVIAGNTGAVTTAAQTATASPTSVIA